MKQSETAKIVVWVQAVDGRVINDLTVEAWHQLIGHFPFEKVEAVVRDHYKRQSRQMYPADIVNKLDPYVDWMNQ